MNDPAINPALAFRPAAKIEMATGEDGKAVETFVPTETVFVRHRAHPAQELRVTAVDEQRGRWVCCAWKSAPDVWQHERYRPDELEEVRREPREVA